MLHVDHVDVDNVYMYMSVFVRTVVLCVMGDKNAHVAMNLHQSLSHQWHDEHTASENRKMVKVATRILAWLRMCVPTGRNQQAPG